MTNRWTQDIPTEEGYYWLKTTGKAAHKDFYYQFNIEPVRVRFNPWNENKLDVDCLASDEGVYFEHHQDTWWYGPLEAPPGPDPERQAEVSLSDLRPAEGNVGPNRGYLEGLGHGKVPTNMDAYGIEPQVNHYPDSLLPFDLARWQQPEGSQPGSFRASLYDPYGEELDD